MSSADRAGGGATATLRSEREIVIVRRFAAPRADVFDAWTTAARIADWWDPRRRPLAACDVDLRPGGASPGSVTVGTLVFDEADGVTTLTITMTAASPADREALLRHRVDAGTVQTLENLAAHLATTTAHDGTVRSPRS